MKREIAEEVRELIDTIDSTEQTIDTLCKNNSASVNDVASLVIHGHTYNFSDENTIVHIKKRVLTMYQNELIKLNNELERLH